MPSDPAPPPGDLVIRPVREGDLTGADRVLRLAFGTFLGLPDPMAFLGDAAYVAPRWMADPALAIAAEAGGRLVGSAFATSWGSVGILGPVTVDPGSWDRSIGQRLIEPILDRLAARGTTLAGLFTFAQSPKHLALYQKFGFWPRFLTLMMSRPIGPSPPLDAPGASRFSGVPERERASCLEECRSLTDALYPGLDVAGEVQVVETLGLGDTVLMRDGSRLRGLAVCHVGPGSEAGGGVLYVKFAAARPGPDAPRAFDDLLGCCDALGSDRGATRVVAGISAARHEGYALLLARGFRIERSGVAMHRPDDPGYSRSGLFVLDDWR